MDVVYERCCGLDVHKKQVTACMMISNGGEKPKKEIKSFPTMTDGLRALREWILENGCSHIVMESTGVYWKPVYNLLEEVHGLQLILANARHVKNVPDRKTDVKDAEWLASLLRAGLVERSFVPPKDIRELRDLVRYRERLMADRTAEKNRVQKLLEDANIKLASVASDIFGVSGQLMLNVLLKETEVDLAWIADLAKGKLRDKRNSWKRSLMEG